MVQIRGDLADESKNLRHHRCNGRRRLRDCPHARQGRLDAGACRSQRSEGRTHRHRINAGAIFWKRKQTAEGFEATLALNHLNYFLLTNLLLDRLKAAPSARIVNVASRAHVGASVDFDDMDGTAVYKRCMGGWIAYQRSKLQNIMFTYALARRLEGTNVTANALHPGFVKTRFGKDNGGAFAVILNIGMRVSAISVQKGAETQTYLARSPEVEGVSGKYFSECRAVTSTKQSMDEAAQERLWAMSEDMTRGSQ